MFVRPSKCFVLCLVTDLPDVSTQVYTGVSWIEIAPLLGRYLEALLHTSVMPTFCSVFEALGLESMLAGHDYQTKRLHLEGNGDCLQAPILEAGTEQVSGNDRETVEPEKKAKYSNMMGTKRGSKTVTIPASLGKEDEDDGDPERKRDPPSVPRRSETDKFTVYVSRAFRETNTLRLQPALPWVAIRLSAPEYHVGVQVRDARDVVTPIANHERAYELLRTNDCRHLRLVTFNGRTWVWSKVASVSEQHAFLGLPPPDVYAASRDIITDAWKRRQGDSIPVVHQLGTGILSSDYVNEVVPTPVESVYVHRVQYKTKASSVLIWGLYRDSDRMPHMTIVSMCQSDTRGAIWATEYKDMMQDFELMLTYSPDTDMESRLPTVDRPHERPRRGSAYAPSRHPMSIITHSWRWGRDLVESFTDAFVVLLEQDRRMKMPIDTITQRYPPCLKETMCAPDERWVTSKSRPREPRSPVGTCSHIEFVGNTAIRPASDVWDRPYTHPLDADLPRAPQTLRLRRRTSH